VTTAARVRRARDRARRKSAWLLLLGMFVEAAPATYEVSKQAEWSTPLDYAMCPRCKTLNALAAWKCPNCRGALSFDIHRVDGKRKVLGNCAACGGYAPDFKCTGCGFNMSSRF
jgi:hypothetical protein